MVPHSGAAPLLPVYSALISLCVQASPAVLIMLSRLKSGAGAAGTAVQRLFPRGAVAGAVAASILFPAAAFAQPPEQASLCAAQALAGDHSYCLELMAAAGEMSLAAQLPWLQLLHYRPALFGRLKSQADDPQFFNSPSGKTNPESELLSTLEAFFAPEKEGEQHPQCRFIARYEWLKDRLKFDSSRLPEHACPAFAQWFSELRAEGATLIFPAAYLNNPASMFGHTLLRIDGQGQNERNRVLAYSANYGAATGDDGGAAFALKGIFGAYRGGFTVEPYYKQVEQYGDIENRDLWEYKLELTGVEMRRLLTHLWELGHTYFNYYFFDENCSYHLLSLLDYARPEMKITERLLPWVIPSEAVRAVVETPDLVGGRVYRPSAASLLSARLEDLPERLRRLPRSIAEGADLNETGYSALNAPEKARVLELTVAYLDYLRLSGAAEREFRPDLARSLLVQRAAVDWKAPAPQPALPATRPEQGHLPGRLVLGAGSKGGRAFYQAAVRPAYHELLDPQEGYAPGAQIDFLSLELRQYEGGDLKIEKFVPLNILSVTPRNELLRPWSWSAAAGAGRREAGEEHGCSRIFLKGGPGAALKSGVVLAYLLLEGEGQYYDDCGYGQWAAGAGPRAGLVVDVSSAWRSLLSAQTVYYPAGAEHHASSLSLTQRLTLDRSNALALTAASQREFDDHDNSLLIAWHHFF